MKRFEYKVYDCSQDGVPGLDYMNDGMEYIPGLEKGLDEWGADGWELCGSIGTYWIFKREKYTLSASDVVGAPR